MSGMHQQTGRAIGGLAHLQQSVQDILTTPLGSRVMRREYGSLLPTLIDKPLNSATAARCAAAAASALMRWEPRMRIQRITMSLGDTPGQAILDTWGAITIDGITRPLHVTTEVAA